MPHEERLRDILGSRWGYDGFRPLQREAMEAILDHRDSLVVLPTGGGKSLCYQAPATLMEGTALVVSPLISLMQDQVHALQQVGIAAAYLNSTQLAGEQDAVLSDLHAGRLTLLYLAPERFAASGCVETLRRSRLSFIAIDEAHCISMWGHDFRPHYRELSTLREMFPDVGVHGFTATATEQVRADVVEQLHLKEPEVLVGSFDRPNLLYRAEPRKKRDTQVLGFVRRYAGQSGIVYCVTRRDVEDVARFLKDNDVRVARYHAGLPAPVRQRNQQAFIEDRVDVIVATVAFGMGIDKPDVRFVLHTGIPKSLEHYQQESGRAGRDGLDAECLLLYSGSDIITWEKMLGDQPEAVRQSSLKSLRAMTGYCHSVTCRHRSLVRHFGQELPSNCGTHCDACLGELELLDDSLVVAQKILSSVYRQGQRFGASYTAKVLTGSEDKQVVSNGHDRLSTYGLLSEEKVSTVRQWIDQLVAQECLRTGEYGVLLLTDEGQAVLKGEHTPRLLRPRKRARTKTESADSWEGVDRELYEMLRSLRTQKARDRAIPPYMVFGDAALRDMARKRPTTRAGFLTVRGVGEKRADDYAEDFTALIAEYCDEQQFESDIAVGSHSVPHAEISHKKSRSAAQATADDLFASGHSIEEVAERLGRAASTAEGYLDQYLQHHGITDPSPWVDEQTRQNVEEALAQEESERLKPVFDRLEGSVDYASIRIVRTCLTNRLQHAGDG